jgi:hypothetical protein
MFALMRDIDVSSAARDIAIFILILTEPETVGSSVGKDVVTKVGKADGDNVGVRELYASALEGMKEGAFVFEASSKGFGICARMLSIISATCS